MAKTLREVEQQTTERADERAATEAVVTAPDPIEAAKAARLRYVSDSTPGIRRHRNGDSFAYTDPDGRPVDDAETLARIRSLAIPPAWSDVWICPQSNGHIQATGRDAKGRKQYRYHPRWREVRDETKYERLAAFGRALPTLRERVDRDMSLPGLPRDKVVATVVRLLDTALIRVGNDEYARTNGSVGLTTMTDDHVEIDGASLVFSFRGKSGKEHRIGLRDRRLARIVGRCRDLPGYDLFQYIDDDGRQRTVGSSDVNDYLRAAMGEDFTAKDFRTWAGTVRAALVLAALGPATSQTQGKRNVVAAVKLVAAQLGNTAAVCRRCYVHPAVFDAYDAGTLTATMGTALDGVSPDSPEALRRAEEAVLGLLDRTSRQAA